MAPSETKLTASVGEDANGEAAVAKVKTTRTKAKPGQKKITDIFSLRSAIKGALPEDKQISASALNLLSESIRRTTSNIISESISSIPKSKSTLGPDQLMAAVTIYRDTMIANGQTPLVSKWVMKGMSKSFKRIEAELADRRRKNALSRSEKKDKDEAVNDEGGSDEDEDASGGGNDANDGSDGSESE